MEMGFKCFHLAGILKKQRIINKEGNYLLTLMYHSSAPSRVCLYGEHQDYLQLKVIPCAIDLRLDIHSNQIDKDILIIQSENLKETVEIHSKITKLSEHQISFRTYLEAGILALKNSFREIEIPSLEVSILSDIPIASGLSSSAALLVGWIKHLSGILKLPLKNNELAELAYEAEHDIMDIPCGRMDQYSSTFGGIISLLCTEPPKLKQLQIPDFKLIVVDSKTPKLTSEVHRKKVEEIKSAIREFEKIANVSFYETSADNINKYQHRLKASEMKILEGVISIKDNTETAEKELLKTVPNLELLGKLLTSQQNALRDGIGVSLPILDKIVSLGKKYGALGGKLTGAGLGGSVVLLTSEDDFELMYKMEQELQLPIWSVKIDQGVTFREDN